MAATLPIQLNLPADLYARIQEAAARSDQPIESVLVESLALLFGTSPVDHPLTECGTLPDYREELCGGYLADAYSLLPIIKEIANGTAEAKYRPRAQT